MTVVAELVKSFGHIVIPKVWTTLPAGTNRTHTFSNDSLLSQLAGRYLW